MKRFVEGLDRGQSTLFPASLDDYLTGDKPVRAVDVFVDSLELDKLGLVGVQPLDTGRSSYHPRTMLNIRRLLTEGAVRASDKRAVCRDRCLSGCRWGRHAGPLPARRRRLAAVGTLPKAD
jgi:hypothetical protein